MWGLIGAPQCAPSHILPQPQILFDLFPLALFHSSGRLRWSKWKKIYCSKHFFLTSREREVAGRRLPPRIFDFSLLFFLLNCIQQCIDLWSDLFDLMRPGNVRCESSLRSGTIDRTKSTLIHPTHITRKSLKFSIDYRLWFILMI